MICAKSYQDIRTPDELEEDRRYESIYESLINEFDPDELEEMYEAEERTDRQKHDDKLKELQENK